VDGRVIVIGFRRWRAWNLLPLLRATAREVCFVRDVAAALRIDPRDHDRVIVWGATEPPGLDALRHRVVRIEDGFIRSVGLGSDLIPPRSLVFDPCGIYFDATRPSSLERILAESPFDAALCARAAALRAMIVARGLTKYNVESPTPPAWPSGGRRVVLVPGQVESDASIALGCAAQDITEAGVRTNSGLLAAARAARPDAWIVYKPHPDVMAGNRRGALATRTALAHADHVETGASILACLAHADEVHTMTSLSGFDAMLRGVQVVTYGAPFYAGWGLTEDRAADHPAFARRRRQLDLDQLVAGTLLLYPQYWDPAGSAFVTAEAALAAIASERDRLLADPSSDRLLRGFWRRQARKAQVLGRAWLRWTTPARWGWRAGD
jgi:capsular polysaccharide export protein